MKSVAENKGQYFDSRMITMRCTFFSLTEEDVNSLAKAYYSFMEKIFGQEGVLDWKFEKRTIKNYDGLTDALKNRKMKNGSFGMVCEGFYRSNEVYNKTTLRSFQRHEILSVEPFQYIESNNTKFYKEKILPFMKEPDILKKHICMLFDTEEGVFAEKVHMHDFGGFFSCGMSQPGFYQGDYVIGAYVYSLEDQLDWFNTELVKFGYLLMGKMQNINIVIQINSTAECYSRYYGRVFDKPGYKGGFLKMQLLEALRLKDIKNIDSLITVGQGMRYCYLTELGWGNFICERTRKLAGDSFSSEDGIVVESLPEGGMFVRLVNPISKLSIRELKKIKRCIYRTIMPRELTMPWIGTQMDGILDPAFWPLEYRLRREWEIVPVFEDEITLDNYLITFKHYGEICFPEILEALKLRKEDLV